MPKTKKKETKRGGVVSGALLGAIASIVLIAVYAIIVDRKPGSAEYAEAVIIAINFISAMICGRCAAKGREQKRAVAGLAAGALYCLMIIFAALAISAQRINAYELCEIALICLSGSAVGSMLNLYKSNKRLRFISSRRR